MKPLPVVCYYDHTQYKPLPQEQVWKPDLIDTIVIVKRNLNPAKERLSFSPRYRYTPSAAYFYAVSKLFNKKPKN